jgi:hypothetical protein
MSHRRAQRGAIALLMAAGLALSVIAPVLAASSRTRVTWGDVRALFETRTTSNQIQLSKGLMVSAPGRAFSRGRINPFFDGQQLCDRDWLVLLVSFGGDQRLQSTRTIRAGTSVDFLVDGSPVSTRETAIKRFLAPNPTAYFFGWSVGHFYAPGSLSDGTHALDTTFHSPGGGSETLSITFDVGGGASFCG